MTTTPEFTPSDEGAFEIASHIDRFGFVMLTVGPGICTVPNCPCMLWPYTYSYSVGLHRLGHPEIVLFGLDEDMAHSMAHIVHDPAADGHPLEIGRDHVHEIGAGLSFVLEPVPEIWVRRDRSRVRNWWPQYGRNEMPEFVQVCWSDDEGRMPWHEEFDPSMRSLQPVLSGNPIVHPPRLNRATRRRRRR